MDKVHIYHIKATKGDKDERCHYTGTIGAMNCVRDYLLDGRTVEIYMEN